MKLIKINQSQVGDTKELPGLVNYQVEYEVKTAKGTLDYQGPKFTAVLWHQVLSFFRWTYKEHNSECQVRLYVNVNLGRWAAWAFPQQARTGMTARELPVTESPEKARERFSSWQSEPSDDWLYFGTVHHHCSASAFQSSTDEQNEWNQDGLHITVGKMDQERHDLHARFYLGGNCFEPDLSLFWEIDAELAEQVPASMHHELACHQMCAKVTVDFPEAWRANLIETKKEERPASPDHFWRGEATMQIPPRMRLENALEEISQRCAMFAIHEGQWLRELQTLLEDEVSQILISACIEHGVTPEDLIAGVSQSLLEYHWLEH
jgi:hypothetical protein